jgi:hypothetical protein
MKLKCAYCGITYENTRRPPYKEETGICPNCPDVTGRRIPVASESDWRRNVEPLRFDSE